MPKTTKKISETQIDETTSQLLVKTISVGHTRKINVQNYDPKLPYESVERSETAWADIDPPVPAEQANLYFEQLEQVVKGRVTEGLHEIIGTLMTKGRTPKLEMNAVYGAFKNLCGQSGMSEDNINEAWNEFIKDIAAYSKENFA